MLLRRTLPEGPHPFTPKSPQPQKRWELSYEVSQNGERGILSLRSRLRCLSSRSLCSDEPSPRVLIPLHQKAPSRKSGGSFLTKYLKTEREGYSHFVRDCEAYPPEAYAPTTPPPRILIPLHQKAPSRKSGGSFLTKYLKTEREGFEPSHRLRSLTP